MYENVHPNLALALLFIRTEVTLKWNAGKVYWTGTSLQWRLVGGISLNRDNEKTPTVASVSSYNGRQ